MRIGLCESFFCTGYFPVCLLFPHLLYICILRLPKISKPEYGDREGFISIQTEMICIYNTYILFHLFRLFGYVDKVTKKCYFPGPF